MSIYQNRPPASDRGNVRMMAFYAVVVAFAIMGQAQAATVWLGWPMLAAVAAVSTIEFGGIVLSIEADHRRQLGERAYTYRVLSAVVAALAVGINVYGHWRNPAQVGLFAGLSALGYTVWVLKSGADRRDALRAAKMLPPVPPAYGAEWIRHPLVTWRARGIFMRDAEQRLGDEDERPGIGLYESLDAAREEIRMRKRNKAVEDLLRKQLSKGAASELAVTAYDLPRLAEAITAQADYEGLAALIGADLRPTKLVPGAPRVPVAKAEASAGTSPVVEGAKTGRGTRKVAGQRPAKAASGRKRPTAEETRQAVLRAAAAVPPGTPQDVVAAAAGVTARTARKYLPARPAEASAVA